MLFCVPALLYCQVLFEDKKASGVLLRVQAGERTVLANKEIILCAGAIGTPQLLMLSGVGPQEQVASVIPVEPSSDSAFVLSRANGPAFVPSPSDEQVRSTNLDS